MSSDFSKSDVDAHDDEGTVGKFLSLTGRLISTRYTSS